MRFDWQTRKERILRGLKIAAKKKLEGMRLMNELADKVLLRHQKIARRKVREKRLQ